MHVGTNFPGGEVRAQYAANWVTPIALALALLTAEWYSHTLFHTLAEFFAVIVAMLVAVVGWQAYPFSRSSFLMYLAIGYFWIGLLDLAHALTYKGVGIIPLESGNISIQLWVGTRYLEAFLLLTAPLAMHEAPARRVTFSLYGIAAILLVGSVGGGFFPTAFIPGAGLTPFKVISEYVIIAVLAGAFAHLWFRRAALDSRLVTLTLLSITATVVSEAFLTGYTTVGELPTIVAHLLKIVSYWLIYVGTVGTTLTEPFRTLAQGASTFDAVPDPTIVVDNYGIIRQTNRAARAFVEMSDAECIGRHCHVLLHDARVTLADCPVCRAISAQEPLEDHAAELPQRHEWHRISLSPITAGTSVVGMVHVSRDVTQRMRSAQALLESEARFRGLVESTNDWVWEVDEQMRYSYASPQVKKILGYAPEELLGKTPLDIMPPAEAERIRAICLEAIASHEPIKGLENINLHKNGSEVVLETSGSPFFDDAGQFRGFRGIDRDITDRKRIERELAEYQTRLEHLVAERTAALEAANRELGAFSYSVSHDLRAPLRAIDGFGHLLVNRHGEKFEPAARTLLERMIAAAARMSQLIDALLQLSRLSNAPLRLDAVDLSAMAREIVGELKTMDPERQVKLRIADGLSASADHALLRVALANLLDNAWKFTVGRTPAEIELGHGLLDGEPYYYVRDNGAGFDMQYAGKLFTAFQRLHGPDEFPGTGIGLATVQRVIHRHGGRIWAEGEVGKGATLYFTLPQKVQIPETVSPAKIA